MLIIPAIIDVKIFTFSIPDEFSPVNHFDAIF